MDIGKFSTRKLPVVIRYGGESFKAEYKAGKEAREFEQTLQSVQTMGEDEAAEISDGGRLMMCEALSKILVSWEIEADGKKVPLEAKAMDALEVPSAFFNVIASKLGEELNGGSRGSGKA